ncbi:MAG TPA: hypothetical protein VNU68_00790 [Verrucomicrobiae bacterium]|nr:hypothetical protein [Verrucomicrobiae bacterium]
MTRLSRFSLVALTLAMGLSLAFRHTVAGQPTTSAASPNDLTNEIAVLRAEINRLKGIVPDQSHAMKDVAYHFGNLWFAGQKTNWPLADFYWSETRSHLRWAVRIIPVRKDPQGNEIRLTEILDPIDRTALQQVGDAIKAKDSVRFVETYKQMLDSCYACHLVSGKPFLRLQIPVQPEVTIIRFEPNP